MSVELFLGWPRTCADFELEICRFQARSKVEFVYLCTSCALSIVPRFHGGPFVLR